MKIRTKLFFAIMTLLTLSSCRSKMTAQILEERCNGRLNGNEIADVDGETKMCLIVETERPFLTWRWSDDGSTLAFSLPDPTIIRPANLIKFSNQPLTANWYVMDRSDRNAAEFRSANYQELYLSPDGEYVITSILCSMDTVPCHAVYKTSNGNYVCTYAYRTFWSGNSDCPELSTLMPIPTITSISFEGRKSATPTPNTNEKYP